MPDSRPKEVLNHEGTKGTKEKRGQGVRRFRRFLTAKKAALSEAEGAEGTQDFEKKKRFRKKKVPGTLNSPCVLFYGVCYVACFIE